jgi:hypothetical protein
VGGATESIPGVYSTVTVEGDVSNITPSPRNVIVIGEAVEGAPFGDVDLRQNYFTDLATVKATYGSGPVVDACAQLFSNQPNAVFTGSVGRVYIAKTNQSARASHAISSPTGYGTLYYSKYGDPGNFVREQIKDATTEVKPAMSFTWIPTAAAMTVRGHVNGVRTNAADAVLDITDHATSLSDLATKLGAGVTVAGAFKATTAAGTNVLTVTVSGSTATFTYDTTWTNTPVAGDTLIVPVASAVKGASDQNIGVYVVTSATATTIVATKIKSFDTNPAEIAHVNPEAASAQTGGAQNVWATAEIIVIGKLSFTSTTSTVSGAGASFEFGQYQQAILGVGSFIQWSSLAAVVSQSVSSVASLSVAVSGADATFAITDGTFATIPAAGDHLFVPASSILAGAGNANVGSWVVKSATNTTIVANKVNGLAPAVVGATFMNGVPGAIQWHAGVITNSLGAKVVNSTAERAVKIEATNVKTGVSFPTTAMGGSNVFDISFYDASCTSATVSIDNARRMQFTLTGATPSSRTVYLNRYNTLKDLADYLNTLPGFKAAVANPKWNSYPTTILDAVQSLGIRALGSAQAAAVGRIKADFWSWSSFISGAGSILSFEVGAMVFPAGLPAAEGSASYLSGGALGGTTNTNVSDALTAMLMVPARQVLPCFSRDARYDIDESMTDSSSSYTIDGINALVSAHVSTASSDINRHERLGALSFYGSFTDSVAAATSLFAYRCSMAFQQVKATDADGNVKWFLPWMLQAMLVAGRSQSLLGTSMLRKNFRLSDVRHIGALPLSSDVWTRDFDNENPDHIRSAIDAGLLVIGPVPGSGLKLVTPDLTTQSGVNDPKAFYYERSNVIFTLDEILETSRNALENYIGSRTSDVSTSSAASAVDGVLGGFVSSGSLLAIQPTIVQDLGTGYAMVLKVRPTESLEFITLNATVSRNV